MSKKDGPPRRPRSIERPAIRTILVLLLLAGILSTLVEGFFRHTIVLPILQAITGIYRLYLAPPQIAIWYLVATIGVILMARALWSWPAETSNAPEPAEIQGQVAKLAAMIPRARDSDYFRWQLVLELEQLAVGSLQQAFGMSARQLRHQVLAGDVLVGPALKQFFEVRATIPTYRRFIDARTSAGRKPITVLAELDLVEGLRELETWFSLPRESE